MGEAARARAPPPRLGGRPVAAHAHHHGHGAQSLRALGWALALLAAYTAAEIVGGLATGSLALLADAGHMVSDVLSLALAVGAIVLARRPATPSRSFGFRRAEILAAFVNGLALVAVAIWVAVEAVRRLSDPPEVVGGWMLVVACGGLAVNVLVLAILARAGRESLNVEAALRHVLGDALGSVGAIVAAVAILAWNWKLADPLVSLLIGAFIALSAWGVLRDSTRILLEAAPSGLDAAAISRAIDSVPGVDSVHDLHVWTITSGFDALSAHVLVASDEDCHARRRDVERMLHDRFGIEHTTLQVEHAHSGLLQIDRLAR